MDTTVRETLARELTAASTELATHVETLRSAARTANQLGALASRVQGAAQDAEFEAEDPRLRQALQDTLQRTGYVNARSGDLAARLRDLLQGVLDLQRDVVTALEPAAGEGPG